jgi:hypothetical protein
MKLSNFTRKEIDAALGLKGIKRSDLAEKLGRSTSAISKVINGNLVIKSSSLEDDVFEALKPEIFTVHTADIAAKAAGDVGAEWPTDGHELQTSSS